MGHSLLRVMFRGALQRQFPALSSNYEIGTFNKHLLCHLSQPETTMVRNLTILRKKGIDKKKTPVTIKNNEISQLVSFEKLSMDLKRPIDKMKEEFIQHLSLSSPASSLESLKVRYDGKDYELQDIAEIIKKNPKSIVLNFMSFPQMIPSALKAIQATGLNLNPQQDGTTLVCPLPKITKEHREQVFKNAKILFTKCKENIKDVQIVYIKSVKNQVKVPEDLSRNVIRQIMLLSEKHAEEANLVFFAKQKEIFEQKEK